MSWKDVEASRALIEQTLGLKALRVLGHLFTTWSKEPTVADWPPLATNAGLVRQGSGLPTVGRGRLQGKPSPGALDDAGSQPASPGVN